MGMWIETEREREVGGGGEEKLFDFVDLLFLRRFFFEIKIEFGENENNGDCAAAE